MYLIRGHAESLDSIFIRFWIRSAHIFSDSAMSIAFFAHSRRLANRISSESDRNFSTSRLMSDALRERPQRTFVKKTLRCRGRKDGGGSRDMSRVCSCGIPRASDRSWRLEEFSDCSERGPYATRTCFLMPIWISSAVLLTPRSSIIWYLWNAMVRGVTRKIVAASFIDFPSANSCSTSR